MTTINQLSTVDALQSGDQFPLYDISNGDARKTPLSLLLAYIQANIVFPADASMVTQYASPSSTGFSITITDGADDTNSVHLILTPTAGYAAGTIVLPPSPGAADKQEVLVNCTQQVNTLTINGNGATAVTGEPTALAADDFFRLKYDLPTRTWYRVG